MRTNRRGNRGYVVYMPPAHGKSQLLMPVARLLMTEEQLGENVRDACAKMGWKFYWLRKTIFGAAGILDLFLVPVRHLERRHILHRELKGWTVPKKGKPRLGTLSDDQTEAIRLINVAGGDAALWVPEDWTSDRILKELE